MSRNAPQIAASFRTSPANVTLLAASFFLLLLNADSARPDTTNSALPSPRVCIVHDDHASEAFKPDIARVRTMFDAGLRRLTGRTNTTEAWGTLVSAKDVVGIKVFSGPGADAGTRPAVVEAVVGSLIDARIAPSNILIWDRQRADLRKAGFMELAARLGVRADGSAELGFDSQTHYAPERPVPGLLVFGDVEFGNKGEGVGRRSHVSRLLTDGITKIISVTPMLNHNTVGTSGHLYSLAQGSMDNFIRFENDLAKLATAVPEIYALPPIADKSILHITDALITQYHGESQGLLHYAVMMNELRLSKDPVALDLLSLRDLERIRQAARSPLPRENAYTNQVELLLNAALLELGTAELNQIKTEHLSLSSTNGGN